VSEALRALKGAWRLAHADPAALAYFDRSVEGFWRSFRAALIVAPGYLVLLAVDYQLDPPTAGFARVAIVEAFRYVILWTAYPLIMESVSRLIGREREYVGYIVAYNWSALVQIGLLLLAIMLARGLPAGLGGALINGVHLALLVYAWMIARLALGVGPFAAVGIVVLDTVLSLFIGAVADRMIYLPVPPAVAT
jgi:hypothetical protein